MATVPGRECFIEIEYNFADGAFTHFLTRWRFVRTEPPDSLVQICDAEARAIAELIKLCAFHVERGDTKAAERIWLTTRVACGMALPIHREALVGAMLDLQRVLRMDT
jgi:hypothetical protein